MSWQDYVDKQLLASRCVTKAAIAGHDGNLWAKSEGFEVSNRRRISADQLLEISPTLLLAVTGRQEGKCRGVTLVKKPRRIAVSFSRFSRPRYVSFLC